MTNSSLTIEQIVALLIATPERIAGLSTGREPAELHTAPNHAGENWSANDVLAHLRACADVWGDCIQVLIAENNPTIRAINPVTWIKRTDYRELEFGVSLHAFTQQRADLLTNLKSLPPTILSRTATVTGAGKPLERTLLSFARRLVIHERPHIKQIQRIINMVH